MKNDEEYLKVSTFQKEPWQMEEYLSLNFPMLIIINIDLLKIWYLNKMVEIYCGIEADYFLKEDHCFYKELIHPDDHGDYISHLNNLIEEEEKDIIIRLRQPDDSWAKFCFKDRIYTWNPKNNEGKKVMSQVYKISTEILASKEENVCEEITEDPIPPTPYRELLKELEEAYCVIEMIFDRNENPVDFLFIETNPAFENEINLKNVCGKTMREMVPDNEDYWFEKFGNVALTGIPIRFQEYGEKLGKVWFDLYAFKVGNENSMRIAILFHNITKRKKAEKIKSLEEKEVKKRSQQLQDEFEQDSQILQTVFDTTNIAIVVFKALYGPDEEVKDFLFVRVNRVLRELYLDQDVLGKSYLEISRYGVEIGIFDAFKEVMKTGSPLEKEFYFDREGFNNWFKITARKQNNLLITTMEDITSRKMEAEKLKRAVRFKKQLVKTSPDTIVIVNLKTFKVNYINQDILKTAGMTRKRILGMTLTDILNYIHPRDRELVMDFHRKILKSSEHEVFDLEFRVKTEINNWEWFNARGKIFNRKNKDWVEEYVLLVRNITHQKETQRALLNAERLSIQGEVARTFAHELRNPLASIRMATDVIKFKIDPIQKELLGNYFEILSRSTRILNNLVTNLLNASNYSPAVLKKLDLAECINETLEMAADRIYLSGVKVLRNYRGPYYIKADKEKLKIALLNIILNASEATPPDKGIIKLTVKKFKSDFLLNISDNGHGLEKEQIDRLFDAFYTNKATGAGIGLNSVKNILEEHDAQIKVKSKPKEGTSFSIYFQDINSK